MVTAITEGIRISVSTRYRGSFRKPPGHCYVFSYEISIENHSEEPVQLLRRQWIISDSLHRKEKVEGPGVIGETPIILPGEAHMYQSGCHLRSNMGSMRGAYLMKRIKSDELFHVRIPIFQLCTPCILN